MHIIIHRVNSIYQLSQIPQKYGIEIDVREQNGKLILSHDPFKSGDNFNSFLSAYHHSFIIFNIKTSGIENKVLKSAKIYHIKNYFLLDVEPVYLYTASRSGIRNVAVRYSEYEPIENIIMYQKQVDWVFIDTMTRLPFNKTQTKLLKKFKTCLVSPERWNRPNDISRYIKLMKIMDFMPDAVMTSMEFASEWEHY